MSLKVLLTLPIREGNNFQISPDLGLLYLGTALEASGFQVTLLDCPKERFSFQDFHSFVRENEFDVVGLRCFSRDHNYVDHHLNIAKDVNPNILTLVGGPHPSALPEFVLAGMSNLDFAWKSEAEEGLPQLLSLFGQHGLGMPEADLKEIPGLVWRSREEDQIVTNPVSLGKDLDAFGLPRWELMKPETYPGFIWDEYYPVYTTRGCPYPCTYCNAPNLSGRKLRHRSVEGLIEELTMLKQRYQTRRFSIIDDEFTLHRKFTIEFCEAMIDARLDLKFDCPNGVRIDSLDPELLQLMEAAGCESLAVGIESGSERIQEIIKKRTTVAKIRERAEMIAGCSGIKITGYFMIGFLDETEEEIRETIEFATSLPLVRANFNVVIPIPGTEIFDECLAAGRLKVEEINWDQYTSDQIAFERNHVSGKQLLRLQRQAYLRFYGRPHLVFRLAKDSVRDREVIWASVRKLKMILWRNNPRNFVPMYLREALP